MDRFKIAQYIALGATVSSVLAIILGVAFSNSVIMEYVSSFLIVIGLLGALVSYIMGGGLGKAFVFAGKALKWGWLLIPFPFNFVTGICAFIYAVFAMLLLPIIPVRMACKERCQ